MALSADQQTDINQILSSQEGTPLRARLESRYELDYGETYLQTLDRERRKTVANLGAISNIFSTAGQLSSNAGSGVLDAGEATAATLSTQGIVGGFTLPLGGTTSTRSGGISANADTLGSGISVPGQITQRDVVNNNTIVTPTTITATNDPLCDYRYSFGCPVFSKRQTDAGCRILVPIYRTCYLIPSTLTFDSRNNSTFGGQTELYGTFEITAAVQNNGGTLNREILLYQDPETGKIGKLREEGTVLTAEGIRAGILQDLSSAKTMNSWVETRTASGETIYVDSKKPLALDVVFRNLDDPTSSTPANQKQPIASPDAVVEDLIRKCDLRNQPPYCIVSRTFTPNPETRVVTPVEQGPFRGPRVPTGVRQAVNIKPRREFITPLDEALRQTHPFKPCKTAIPRTYQDFQDYLVEYGIPLYDNPQLSGSPISYAEPETVTITEAVPGGTGIEYVGENEILDCQDFREIEKEYQEDDPTDKCFGIIRKDVIRIYADGREQLYVKGAFVRYFRKQNTDCSPETIKVYYPLDEGKDIMPAKIRAKTKGLFDGAQSLLCHHTSSTQPTASKTHYYEVTDCDSCGKTPYFAVAYGNNVGSGSTWSEGELNDTPTRAIYSQYRLLALDLPETQFTFYTNGVPTSSKDVYVINFSRTGMLDRVDPGNWELPLAELRGGSYANSVFTGSNVAVSSSNKVLTFIDNSDDRSDTISCTHDPYVSYDIVSGSLDSGAYVTSSRHTYGTMYPNLGILILDPYKLNTELGFNTVTGSNVAGDNAFKLFTSISGSGVLEKYVKARNVKYKTTNHYFVRVAASLANFSNNPTWVTGGEGEFFHSCFDKNPQTYITTVGLYDDFNQLLAVAKLSKPINKSFDNDVLIKIRLNW